MDGKKKNFLENLRLKTKFPNLKKPRKKPLSKQDRRLAHRRSISVPNLTLVSDEGCSVESGLESTLSEAIFFGISPRLSDSDSVASGSNVDGPVFTEKIPDSVPETRLRVPTSRLDAGVHRTSAPAGTLFSQDTDESCVKSNLHLAPEGMYAQVDKKAKGNMPKFNFEPIPAPRSVFSNAIAQSPQPDVTEGGSLCGEDTPADSVAAALIRASSLSEQISPYTRKKITSEQTRPVSEPGTPPTAKKAPADRTTLLLDTLAAPMENLDGNSLDSACGTPSEERLNAPWTTDSEDLERDLCSPVFMRDFATEENMLEGVQLEDPLEEMAEVSFITAPLNCMSGSVVKSQRVGVLLLEIFLCDPQGVCTVFTYVDLSLFHQLVTNFFRLTDCNI